MDIHTTRAIADYNAGLEAVYRADEGGLAPDWVYEARRNRMVAEGRLAYSEELCRALGWQGGTIHQVINAVHRLRVESEERAKAKGGA